MAVLRGELLGRERELDELTSVLGWAMTATGAVVVVSGDPGIGKTALLETALASDAADGFTVLRAKASELEVGLPFAALRRALKPRGEDPDDRLVRIAELLTADVHDAARLQVADAIEDHVEDLASAGPVALALDDLQWADDGTVLVLDRLLGLTETLPLVLLLTARDAPRSPALRSFEQRLWRAGARNVRLGPLDEDACLDLARQVLRDVDDDALANVVASSGGNPLFVSEVSAAARTRGTADADVVDEVLGETVQRRLSWLPGQTTALLRDASVLGTQVDLRHLALLREVPEYELVRDLQPALDADLLRLDPEGGLAFRHDLIRDAVYATSTAAERGARHRTVVAVLRAAGVDPSEWLHHLDLAEWRGVDWASAAHHEAGRAALHLDHRLGEDLLLRGIELADEPTVDQLAWFWRVAFDRRDEVRSIVLERVGRGLEVDEWVQFVRQILGDEELCRALLDHQPEGAEQVVPADVAHLAHLEEIYANGHTLRARELVEEARARAGADEGGGDLLLLACIAEAEASLAYQQGREEDLHDRAFRALDLLRRTGPPPTEELGLLGLATAYVPRTPDGLVRHVQAQRRCWRLAEEIGHPTLISRVAEQAAVAFRNGLYDEGGAQADRLLAMLHAADDVNPWWLSHAAAGLRLVGRTDDATTLLARADQQIDQYSTQHPGLPELSAMRLVLDASRAALAWSLADEGAAVSCLARAVDAGEHALAGGRRGSAERLLAPLGLAVLLGDAGLEQRLAAMAATDEDEHEWAVLRRRWAGAITARDVAALQEVSPQVESWLVDQRNRLRAAMGHPPAPLPPLVDAVRLDLREVEAHVAADAGEREWAVDRLEASLAWASDHLPPATRRLQAKLRDLGVKRLSGRRTAPDRAGWGSITEAEWAVLDLLEQGLVYREIAERLFLSRRTVESHVARVFDKVGVRARRDLANGLREGAGARALSAWRGR